MGRSTHLIVDIDMYQLVERGLRGGISMISHRYTESSATRSLLYLDANSLYAWAMSQSLPLSDFEWANVDIDVMQVADDSEDGYILQVDLEYPAQLHDAHNDYPLAPEKMKITRDKTKYVLHYRNLKLYI